MRLGLYLYTCINRRGTLFAPYDYYIHVVGDKECRNTLFVPYITQAILSVGVHSLLPIICYPVGDKECRGTFFVPCITRAILSVGVYSFFPALYNTVWTCILFINKYNY